MENSKVNKKLENFKGFFKPKGGEKPKDVPVASESTGTNGRGFFKTVAQEETSGKALLGLFVYSLLMFFLPLGVYFGSKQLFEDHDFEPPVSTIAPAILAIVTVNIVIVLYVIKAFKEESRANQQEEAKKKK